MYATLRFPRVARRTKRHLLFLSILTTHLAIPQVLPSQERQPADLVDDVARLQALSLEELEWQEEERTEMDGVVEIRGSWSGPEYTGYDAAGISVTLRLTEKARVWIPASLAAGTTVYQVVVGDHRDFYLNREVAAHAELARRFAVASIRHGEKDQDWTSQDFLDRNDWQFRSYLSMMATNLCGPVDYEHSNYTYALVKTQLMALTLLSRLLEDRGYEPGPAGMLGESKEGTSTWIASTVDERLVAIAPGGFSGDFLDWFQSAVDDYGCSEGIERSLGLEWLKTSEGGRVALEYLSVVEFSEYLRAEFCLQWGDVGLNGLHDGTFLLAPSIAHFQETFTAIPNRFDRLPDQHVRETWEERRSRLVELLSYYLVHRDLSSYPEITAAKDELDDEADPPRFRALATVSPEPESVRLWWSHSTSRAFNEPGNAPYLPVEMVLEGDTWVSPWVDIPSDEMIGWFVEAERALDWDGLELMQRDGSPLRFFNEFPPLSCPVPLPDCPPPAPAGLEATPSPGRVDLDWMDVDGFELAGYEVHRALTPDGEFTRISGETPLTESEFADFAVESRRTYSYRVTTLDAWGRVSDPSETVGAETPPVFRRADSNADGEVDISDPLATLGFLFLGEEALACEDAADANDDGEMDVSDAVFTLLFLFVGGEDLPPPGSLDCGVDPTGDGSGCAQYSACP